MTSERSPLLLHDAANGSRAATANGSRASHANGDAQLSYATSVSVLDDTAASSLGYDKRALLATPSCGLSSAEAARRLKAFGANELPAPTPPLALAPLLLRLFSRPRAALVWAALVLELVAGGNAAVVDAAALLLYQLATALLALAQHTRTTHALAALQAALRAEAVVVRDGVHQTINASLLVPGDRLSLAAGVVVPADCELCAGAALQLDQSRLTGESLPVALGAADSAKRGAAVLAGEGDAIVTATGAHSFGAESAHLLLTADALGETPRFETVAVRLTATLAALAAGVLAVGVALQLVAREPALRVAAHAAVFAAVAVPLSMPAVSRLVVAMGARRLLDDKVCVTRLASIEKLASVDVLCCDKTGTLSRNKLELQDDLPIFDPRGTREDVLVSAALAAKWKEPPRDAVDTLVLNAIDLRPLDQYTLLQHSPFDPTSKRTESVIRGPTGRVFKVTKGAPEALLALAHNAHDVRDAVEAKVMDLARRGVSSLAVARTEEATDGKWVFLGIVTYVDPPRHDSKRTIARAHELGLAVKLATGDQAAIAVEACRQLGMGMTVLGADVLSHSDPACSSATATAQITESTQAADVARLVEAADGFAHVLPHHKVSILGHLRRRGWACGVTGASVTDVAAMKVAHLAVAVDGASDAARSVADVVLTKPGLSVVVTGVLGARAVFRRVCYYVTFQTLTTLSWVLWLGVTTLLIRTDSCQFPHFVPRDGHCGVERHERDGSDTEGDFLEANVEHVDAFFRSSIAALVVLGLTQELASIALLHDKIVEPTQPQRWSIFRLIGSAIGVAATAAVSTIVLVFWAVDGWNENGVLAAYHVGALSMGQVNSFILLQVALTTTLSVVVVRSDSHPFASAPSPALVAIVVFNMALATLLALFSPFKELAAITPKQALFVWVYTLLWVFVQAAVKLFVSAVLTEMSRLGVIYGDSSAKSFDRAEAQRQNRIRLGLAFWSDESTVRDSFVVGRAVRSTASPSVQVPEIDQTQHRLSELEAAVKLLKAGPASASSKSKE